MVEDRGAWWASVHGVAKSQHDLETERQHLKCGFSDVSEHRIEASELSDRLAGKNQQEHENTRDLVRSYNMQRTAERTRERFEEMLVKKFSSQCKISSHIFVKIYKNEASEHTGNHTVSTLQPSCQKRKWRENCKQGDRQLTFPQDDGRWETIEGCIYNPGEITPHPEFSIQLKSFFKINIKWGCIKIKIEKICQ